MDLQLTGRTALITGGSKGIGFACAEALAREGCNLKLVSRSESELQAAREQILAANDVKVDVLAIDMNGAGAAHQISERAGDYDFLVNNAGAVPGGPLAAVTEDVWRSSWDVKVFGYINLAREAMKVMKARGEGVILNVIGVAGERPNAAFIAGSTGNAALMALTRALGGTSMRNGIRVVGVNPGPIETERFISGLKAAATKKFNDPDRWRELVDADYPPGKPSQVGDLVAFLLSPRACHISGTVIGIDGGAAAR